MVRVTTRTARYAHWEVLCYIAIRKQGTLDRLGFIIDLNTLKQPDSSLSSEPILEALFCLEDKDYLSLFIADFQAIIHHSKVRRIPECFNISCFLLHDSLRLSAELNSHG